MACRGRMRAKRRGFRFSFLCLFVISLPPAFAQFTAEELARRPFWEEFLKTAEIARFEEIGEGVNKPLKLYLREGETQAKASWKNPRGLRDGFLEGWQYEIAAYRLDKLIGLNMVPPAVEREFDGKPGALVYWVTSRYSLLQIMEEGIQFPEKVLPQTTNTNYLVRAWDSLIANDDRTQQNVLFTEDWRMILIDHSQAFRASGDHTEHLMYGNWGLKRKPDGNPYLFRRLPRWFVENVKMLDYDAVKEAVGPYLTDKEIEAVIKRRALLLAEIDEMIKESGEAQVLY
jgi:hypothetical protein